VILGQRRIHIHEDGRQVPLVPHAPLLSSAAQPWEGFLLERHISTGFDVPRHEHSGIVLSMQLQPSLRVEWRSGLDTGSATVGEGSLTLHGRDGCEASRWTGNYNRVLFELDSLHLERIVEGGITGGRIEVAERWVFEDKRIEYLLRALLVELEQGAPGGKLFGEQVAGSLAVLLAQEYSVVRPKVFGTAGRLPAWRLRRAYDYVSSHLSGDISLGALAAAAEMSSYYFAKLFRATTGMSPHQYVVQQRLERAKILLRNPNMRIYEVGVRVGYVDPKHFRNIFHREVGVTPAEYRSGL